MSVGNIIYDFLENEIPIFGLYGADKDGHCECGHDYCEAPFKHPRASNWQYTPLWSDEQLETMQEMDYFATGYGVLVSGLLVIDVDARNGGVDSFEKLCTDLGADLLGDAGLAVATGSGNGSMHLYFKAPESCSLVQSLDKYPGIDFKSSGYVVGPQSMHASGNKYTILHGSPSSISEAPSGLVELLKRPEFNRVKYKGATIDITESDLRSMLQYYPNNDLDYEEWIRCGMAIHHATNGAGFDIWDDWSQSSGKYDNRLMEKKWHSFGKAANPVTIGTIIHHAKENGWQHSYDDVTFETTLVDDEPSVTIDLKRPPGFVGQVAKWINDQCLYPRESLSVAAALTAVGNIVGLRHVDAMDGMTTNLFCFCVAGSSTGKEAVQQAYMKIMRAAGISSAVHGSFKSEQEVIRNLTRHQMAAYAIDELGIVLKKIKNAQQKGGASYLEGLIGVLMSAFSKADGYMPISGDVREDITNLLNRELSAINKKIDLNEDKEGTLQRRKDQVERSIKDLENGLDSPFLSVLGFTTPVTFNSLMDYEQATNGFLSRSLIFNDLETNPRRKPGFSKKPMTDEMAATLQQLYSMGECDVYDYGRIEHHGEKYRIQSDEEAAALLDQVYEHFWEMAEQHKSASGLEAIPRRGYEIVAKVSTILAAPSGLRTAEHVQWAFAMAKHDCEYKLKLAYANMKDEQDEKTDAVRARIMNAITKDHGETLSVLVNRCRPHKKELVEECLRILLEKGIVIEKETTASNGRKSVRYFES